MTWGNSCAFAPLDSGCAVTVAKKGGLPATGHEKKREPRSTPSRAPTVPLFRGFFAKSENQYGELREKFWFEASHEEAAASHEEAAASQEEAAVSQEEAAVSQIEAIITQKEAIISQEEAAVAQIAMGVLCMPCMK